MFLFADPSTTTSPSWQRHEVMVGEPTLRLEPDELRDLYAEVVSRAAAASASRHTQTESSSPRHGLRSNQP